MNYKLFVSHNLGASYRLEYETDDREDQKLADKIEEAKKNVLRFYVEGDDSVVCPQHQAIRSFFGGQPATSIEDKVSRLREKFCRT